MKNSVEKNSRGVRIIRSAVDRRVLPAAPAPKAEDADAMLAKRRVLNTGAGAATSAHLHGAFASEWEQVRLDIDPGVGPDLVGEIQNMKGLVDDQSFDAIWCSHNLEHVYAHEVVPALAEFRRILKDDGFAIVTCPDLGAIAEFLLQNGAAKSAYRSPAGPISALDMLYGHGRSIAAGRVHMAHKTGFTLEGLGQLGLEAGFQEVRVAKGRSFDLWSILLMPRSDITYIASLLENTPEHFLAVG